MPHRKLTFEPQGRDVRACARVLFARPWEEGKRRSRARGEEGAARRGRGRQNLTESQLLWLETFLQTRTPLRRTWISKRKWGKKGRVWMAYKRLTLQQRTTVGPYVGESCQGVPVCMGEGEEEVKMNCFSQLWRRRRVRGWEKVQWVWVREIERRQRRERKK